MVCGLSEIVSDDLLILCSNLERGRVALPDGRRQRDGVGYVELNAARCLVGLYCRIVDLCKFGIHFLKLFAAFA